MVRWTSGSKDERIQGDPTNLTRKREGLEHRLARLEVDAADEQWPSRSAQRRPVEVPKDGLPDGFAVSADHLDWVFSRPATLSTRGSRGVTESMPSPVT